MFLTHKHAVQADLSTELRDIDDWKIGALRLFDYPINITSIAVEPISCLLAVGTANGVVHIFGGPGVEVKLTLPEPTGVKFLQFAISTLKLVCLDDMSQLHIWDLTTYGRPKLIASARFDPSNFLVLSPSHTHAFLALNSGEIRTYDMICLRKSPYVMPNMWKLYEKEMLSQGLPYLWTPESRIPVEAVIHPRDLNLLFVAYAGGIILSDLTQRNTICVYELVLPPGTPGGSGYGSSDILTARRPPVTTLAIHPTGHFFVVGHADGCLAFWAVEDGKNPLLVRTLDAMDVNVVDTEKLDEHIFQEKTRKDTPQFEREPIFKLSWSGYPHPSDPRGGDTTLTVLGGLKSGEASGLNVFNLPAFNPPEPPVTNSPDSQTLNPFWRTAMRNSLIPSKSYFYYTQGVVQDFVLVPRQSPHFSGTFDPIAILLLTEVHGGTRSLEAQQFPPPSFSSLSEDTSINKPATTLQNKDPTDSVDTLADDLAETLRSLQRSDDPQQLSLPTPLIGGLIHGQLLKVERETYDTLVQGSPVATEDSSLPLKGGVAWANESLVNDLKLSKYQPNRILITRHDDLSIRFHDASAQLLLGLHPTPIQSSFPKQLGHLTVDIKSLLIDPSVSVRTSERFFEEARLESVQFAAESLEIASVLQTGEVLVHRILRSEDATVHAQGRDEEVVVLKHIQKRSDRIFSPYFMLAPRRGPVKSVAISDIGFIAAAYSDGSLYIVDMRIPQIILRPVEEQPGTSKKSPTLLLHRSDIVDPVMSMVWTISALNKDPQPRIRLIALRTSGTCHIYTLTRGSGPSLWICGDPIESEGVPNPLPQGSFILDNKTGAKWKANRSRLVASNYPSDASTSHAILIACGTKGARCYSQINGDRIAKVDWGSKMGNVQSVEILEKLGSHVLVVLNDRNEAHVYSLPHFETLHLFKLPSTPGHSTVDESGDYIVWTPHSTSGIISQGMYSTLFDIRRAYDPPDIDLLPSKPIVPPQPQKVSIGPASLLSSWFTFNQSLTGVQIDELLGGPNRPIPVPEPQPRDATISDLNSGVAGFAAAAAATHNNLYNRLTSALNERGQLLGDLEDRFNALEEGSKNMVSQAKRLATQQTAKSWFGL